MADDMADDVEAGAEEGAGNSRDHRILRFVRRSSQQRKGAGQLSGKQILRATRATRAMTDERKQQKEGMQ